MLQHVCIVFRRTSPLCGSCSVGHLRFVDRVPCETSTMLHLVRAELSAWWTPLEVCCAVQTCLGVWTFCFDDTMVPCCNMFASCSVGHLRFVDRVPSDISALWIVFRAKLLPCC